MTKKEIHDQLDQYFSEIKEHLKRVALGDRDSIQHITYRMYDPSITKVDLSPIDIFAVFEKTIQFLATTMKLRFDIESIKIGGRKWELVTNIQSFKSMPIMIDGVFETTPRQVAGKIIFFILMETL